MKELPIRVHIPAPMLHIAVSLPRSITWPLPEYRGTADSQHAAPVTPTIFTLIRSVAVLLIMGLSTLMLAMLAFTALLHPDGHPDPFTPYEPIVPGRSSALVMARYSCHRELLAPVFEQEPVFAASLGQSSCAIDADAETFSRVTVTQQNGRIQQVQFLPANLQAVELLRRWGRPDRIQRSPQNYLLIWDHGVLAFTPATGRQFSYLLPVNMVLLRSSN
jgi:hypothetical protein